MVMLTCSLYAIPASAFSCPDHKVSYLDNTPSVDMIASTYTSGNQEEPPVPFVKAEFPPGQIDWESYSFIGFMPCLNRLLKVNASAHEEDGPYFVWVFLSDKLEVASMPQNAQIIDDPVYSGNKIIEVSFPANSEFGNPDAEIQLRMKPGSYGDGGQQFYCWAFHEREPNEYPTYYSAKQMGSFWPTTRYFEGQNISLSDLIANQEINDPSSIGRQFIWINGTLIVDTDYEFKYGNPGERSYIGFLENSGIIIENATLTATGTSFRGCDVVWDALEVKAGGQLVLRPGTSTRALVRDALHGVRLHHESRAFIQSTNFFANRIGIYSPPLESSLPTIKHVILNLRSSFFSENEGYIAGGDHPWAGIELHDMTSFFHVCNDAPQTGCSNIIEKSMHGIILRNTSANLSGFQIRDLYGDPSDQFPTAHTGIVAESDHYAEFRYEGYGKGSHPSFKKVADGIRIRNVHAYVENVRMEDMYNSGIWQQGGQYKEAVLKENYIFSGQYGIVSLFNQGADLAVFSNDLRHKDLLHGYTIGNNPQYGIAILNNTVGSTGAIVEDNFIEMLNARAGIFSLNNQLAFIAENTIYGGDRTGEYGIRVSGGGMHLIDCNLASRTEGAVSDPSAGIYVQMLEGSNLRCNALYDYPRGIEYFGMSLGSLMEANELSDHKIGLLYDHEAETGKHEWSGNRWTNEYDTQNDEIGARNTSDDFNKVENSKYYVDITPSGTHGQYGTSVESQHDWFVIWEEPVPTIQCGDSEFLTCIDGPGANHTLFVRPPDSLAWRIAVDSFASPNYGAGAVWTAQRQLYRRLMRSPEFVTAQSEWEGFMDAHENGSVGIFEDIRAGWYAAHQPDSIRLVWISQLTEVKDSLSEVIINLHEAIGDASTHLEIDSLQGLLAGPYSTLTAITESLMHHYDTLRIVRDQYLERLQYQNGQAPDTAVWEFAQKSVNELMIHAVLNGYESLDSMQRVRLQEIAEECPMELGEAVFQARGLLMLWDPALHWDDDTRCSMAQPRTAEAAWQVGQLTVFPNPVRTSMYVHLIGGEEGIWTIQLINPVGQQVAVWERPAGLQGIELPMLPAGIYTLRADHEKGERLRTRVIITR
jgi:hypothetical protein